MALAGERVTLAGWALLIVTCGGITVWVAVCYARILRAPYPDDAARSTSAGDASHAAGRTTRTDSR